MYYVPDGTERRRGYATLMLKTALPIVREMGIDRVLDRSEGLI